MRHLTRRNTNHLSRSQAADAARAPCRAITQEDKDDCNHSLIAYLFNWDCKRSNTLWIEEVGEKYLQVE